jgi:DNA-binding CsgD family transcriptional regulator
MDDFDLLKEALLLYEREPDLRDLPGLVFDNVARLVDADVVTYTEFHHRTRDFRSLMSVQDDPAQRSAGLAAFARHRDSHPFWQGDPAFFGERVLRESDFFGEEEFLQLPIAREVFLPSGARRIMSVMLQHDEYALSVNAYRVLGRPAYEDRMRDLLQAYRPHLLRAYRQAQRRTIDRLGPAERLRFAFPDLTPRQVQAAAALARGLSNEAIAKALGIGLDTVKAHLKAVFGKIGTDSRVAVAALAYTVPPFAQLPPLWQLHRDAWGVGVQPQ